MNRLEGRTFLKRLTRSLKKGAMWLPNKFLAVLEGFEKRIKRLGNNRQVGKRFTAVDNQANQLYRSLTKPFVTTWTRTLSLVEEIRQRTRTSPLFLGLKKRTYWLWYPAHCFLQFVVAFYRTRSKLAIVGTVASILLLGGFVFLGWRLGSQRQATILNYRLAVEEAIGKGDFELADLYQRRLVSFGVTSGAPEMRQIESLVNLGKYQEAIQFAERLAPLTEVGMVNAHLWLAQQYMDDKAEIKGPQAVQIAKQHLALLKDSWQQSNATSKSPPGNLVMLEAMISIKNGNIGLAIDQLKTANNFWPAVALQMELGVQIRNLPISSEAARKLVAMAKKNSEVLQSIPEHLFPVWLSVLVRARDFEDMEFVIKSWNQLKPDDPSANAFMARLQMHEVEQLLSVGRKEEVARAVDLLIKGSVNLPPDEAKKLTQWFLAKRASKLESENYLELERLLKERAELPSKLLVMLGVAAMESGNEEEATSLFRMAITADPQSATAWNQLAELAAETEDLEFAKESAENSVRLSPGDIGFLETRGVIYLKRGLWELAIEDLRKVVAQRPNAKRAHQGLATAYRQVGKEDMAIFHESIIH